MRKNIIACCSVSSRWNRSTCSDTLSTRIGYFDKIITVICIMVGRVRKITAGSRTIEVPGFVT